MGKWFDPYFKEGAFGYNDFDLGFHASFERDSDSVDVDGPLRTIFGEFEEVYNNYEIEFYSRLMKGPEATRQTKTGNDWDQAALLVDNLLAAGLNAEIVSGEVTVSTAEAMQWTGTLGIQAARNVLLNATGASAVVVGDNLRFDRAWVRVQVPDDNGAGWKWLHIDPSWKMKNRQLGIPLSETLDLVPSPIDQFEQGLFDEFAYLADPKDQLPIEYFEDRVMDYLVEHHPGKSLADVAYDGPIIQRSFANSTLDNDEHLNLSGATALGDFDSILQSASAAKAHTHRVQVKVGSWEKELVIPEVSLNTLRFVRTASGFTFYQEGAAPVTVSLGATTPKLQLRHADPGQALSDGKLLQFDFDRSDVDRHYVISIDARQFSQVELDKRREAINVAASNVDSGDSEKVGEADIDEVLEYISAKFWYEQSRDVDAAVALMQAVGIYSVDSGVVMADDKLIDGDFSYLQTPIVPQNTGVDLPNARLSAFDSTTGNRNAEAFQLGGFTSSALEHAVIEEVINNESISTVRGLKDGYLGNPVLDTAPYDVPNSLWIIESVDDPSGRKVYIRGEIGARATDTNTGGTVSLPYDPNETSRLVTSASDLRAKLPGHTFTIGSTPFSKLDGLWEFLTDEVIGDAVAIVPQELSIVGNSSSNWGGTVYYGSKQVNTNSFSDTYAISSVFDEMPTMQGGFSSGLTFPENEQIVAAATPILNFNGDPVNVLNGNMFRDELDISMPNTGVALDFARHYDSQSEYDVGFGRGWVHSFSDRLLKKAGISDEVIWLTSEGVRHTFEKVAGNWIVPNTLFGEFIEVAGSSEEYIFKDSNGIEHHFENALDTPASNIGESDEDRYVSRLTKIIDRNGHGVLINYTNSTEYTIDFVQDVHDFDRRLDFIHGVSGSSTTIELEKHYKDVVDDDTTITAAVGRWIYEFDGVNKDLLTAVKNPANPTDPVVYEYYTTGAAEDTISKIIEADNSYHAYEYYPNGRTFRVKEGIIDGGGVDIEHSSHSFSYNLFTNTTEFIDENGNVETYVHQEDGQLVRQIHADRTRTLTEWGALNGSGEVIEGTELLMRSMTDEIGATETFEYFEDSTGADAYKFRRLKESTGKRRIDPFDSNGIALPNQEILTTQYDYEKATAAGFEHIVNISHVTIDPGTADERKTSYDYDSRGRVIKIADPRGDLLIDGEHTTSFSYYSDTDSIVFRRGLLDRETRPRNAELDGSFPLGDTFSVSYSYNDAGQVKETTRAGQAQGKTEYHHTGLPDLTTEASYGTGARTKSSYDALGRRTALARTYELTFLESQQEGFTPVELITSFQHDERGRVTKSIDALGNTTEFAYDYRGNMTQQTNADGSVVSFEYDAVGNQIAITDELRRTTRFVYDSRNRLVQTIFPDGYSELLRYDGTGRVVSATDALGREALFEYDSRGLLEKTTLAAGTDDQVINESDYNQFGELMETVEDAGDPTQAVVTQMFRDKLGRVTKAHVLDRNDNPAAPNLMPISVVSTSYDRQGNASSTTAYDVTQLAAHKATLLSDDLASLAGNEHTQTTTTYYNAHQNLPEVTVFADGTSIQTEYLLSGRIRRAIDELERETTFDYDRFGRLVEIADPDPDDSASLPHKPVTRYEYDVAGNQVAVLETDEHNTQTRTTRITYDKRNRAVAVTDAEYGQTRTVFDSAGQRISTIDALGRADFAVYDQRGRVQLLSSPDPDGDGPLTPIVTRFEYDAVGNLRKEIDPQGYETLFQYDNLDRLKEEQYTIADPHAATSELVTRSYTYFSNGLLESETDTRSNTTDYTYDELGRVETVELPAPGTNDRHGNPLPRPLTTTEYDGYGNSVRTTEARGGNPRISEWEYDDRNRLVKEILAVGTTDEVATKFEYDEVGNLRKQIDDYTEIASQGINRTTDFGYDNLNRLTSEAVETVNHPATGDLAIREHKTLYEYDTFGNLNKVVRRLEKNDGELHYHESTTQSDFDNLGREISVTVDVGGDLEASTHFEYDAVGNLIRSIDPLGNTSTSTFDRLDRVISSTAPDPDGSGTFELLTTFEYDAVGDLVAQTNGEGETQRYLYDNLGRLVRSFEPRDTGLATPTIRKYDSEGNLIRYEDPLNSVTDYSYDALNRLTEETIDLGGATGIVRRTYKYSSAENVEQIIDREGRERRFEYDHLDRLQTERWLTSGSAEVSSLGWQYDKLGRVTQTRDGQNLATSTLSDDYYEEYNYDDLNRVIRQTNYDDFGSTNPLVAQYFLHDQIEPGNNLFTKATHQQLIVDYYGAGDHASLISEYTTDRLGRLRQMESEHVVRLGIPDNQVAFSYDVNDRMIGIERSADELSFATGYRYDNAGRLKDIRHATDFGDILTYEYVLDEADRITSQTTNYNPAIAAFGSYSSIGHSLSETFGFNEDGHLETNTSNVAANNESFAYDANGNRTGGTVVGAYNRLKEDANYIYAYDHEGNLEQRTSKSNSSQYEQYAWDHRNRLIEVKRYDTNQVEPLREQVTYRYNADDQLVERDHHWQSATQWEHAGTEHYVYNGNQRVLTLDENGRLEHRAMWAPGLDQLLVDEVFDAAGMFDESLWAVTDHAGSVNQLLDSAGDVVEHREFDSFGGVRAAYDASGTAKTLDPRNPAQDLDSDWAFAGRVWDDDAQLYYNRARWYEPESGRFVGEDPATEGSNWYRYAGNDPVNFRDPLGLQQDGHPLSGGFGSGVTKPRNTKIDFGSVVSSTANTVGNLLGQASNTISSAINSAFSNSPSPSASGSSTLGSIGNFVADTASTAFRAVNPVVSSVVNAGIGFATTSAGAIPPVDTGIGVSDLFSSFTGYLRANRERRNQEFQARQHRVALQEAALAGAFGDQAFRAADAAFDRQMRQSDFSVSPQLLAETSRRLEDDVMLHTMGLTRREIALGTVNSIYSLTGQPTITADHSLTHSPGFQIVESAVGAPFNPATYTPIMAGVAARTGPLRLLSDVPRRSTFTIDIDPTGTRNVVGDLVSPSFRKVTGSGGINLAPHRSSASTVERIILRDPRTRRGYDPGSIQLDHTVAEVFGGTQLRPVPAGLNLRKGGLEGELRRYENYLIRNGLDEKQARQVILPEIESLSRDAIAAPFTRVFGPGFSINDIDQ